MSKSILITGANGRLGQAALKAFANAGWSIHTLVRKNADEQSVNESAAGITEFVGDVCDFDAFFKAAAGCSVILHAANPSYELWAKVLPVSVRILIDVAKSVDATILMPGNVYPYGENMPPLLTADTAHSPTCELGQLRAQMERSLLTAAEEQGVQTLLVRAGGFIDSRDTGNWFETYMCKDLKAGKFMYPGNADSPCEWIYLPDVADVMVKLAEVRQELALYEDIGLPGFSVTGHEIHSALETEMAKPLILSSMPWMFVKILSWFVPKMKGVYDMRYLFFVPHMIDGTRLRQILPKWQATTLQKSLQAIFADQNSFVHK